MKKLYEFEVKKTIVEKIEEKTEQGVLVKEEAKEQNVGVFVKLPGRKVRDELSLIYSAEFGKNIGKGLQTRENIRKYILDNGGFNFSDIDNQELDKIIPELNKKNNEFIKAKINGEDAEELKKEILDLSNKVYEMESRLAAVFNHSAENLAQQEVLIWAVLNLTFWDDGTPVFPGISDETKKELYYSIHDDPMKYSAELQAFGSAFIVLDAFLFKNLTEDQIKEIVEDAGILS